MAYLIDTDVMVHSLRGNSKVTERIAQTANVPKAISIVTYGELLYGAKRSAQKEKNSAVVYRLAEILPIYGVSRATMETFTDLKIALEKKGQRIEDFDLLIAATAVSRNYTLVTGNTKHFRRIPGLQLENWLQ